MSTLFTTQPTSAGNILELTSLPVNAYIRARSPPCGYFVYTPFISMLDSFFVNFLRFTIASSLLSSIAIIPLAFLNNESTIFKPSINTSGSSIILL